MPVNINASLTSGIGITSDNSGVIQFQSNGANTISIQANGAILNSSGANIANVFGALIRAPQILTSGTSYTTPANCTDIYVELVGGGGGGGGADTTEASACSSGGGGGSGSYAAKYLVVTGNTAYTYAIGSGGAGGANNGANGTAGSNTTFSNGTITVTAGGGGFGSGANGKGNDSISPGGAGGRQPMAISMFLGAWVVLAMLIKALVPVTEELVGLHFLAAQALVN
jgi:hypothetical protein